MNSRAVLLLFALCNLLALALTSPTFAGYSCDASKYTINFGTFTNPINLYTTAGGTSYQQVTIPPPQNSVSKSQTVYFTVKTGEVYTLGYTGANNTLIVTDTNSTTTCANALSDPEKEWLRVYNLARGTSLVYRNPQLNTAASNYASTGTLTLTNYQAITTTYAFILSSAISTPVNPGAVVASVISANNTYLITTNKEVGISYSPNTYKWGFVWSSRAVMCPNPNTGFVESPEACDDGNSVSGDGCTNCTVDPGYSCVDTVYDEQSVCQLSPGTTASTTTGSTTASTTTGSVGSTTTGSTTAGTTTGSTTASTTTGSTTAGTTTGSTTASTTTGSTTASTTTGSTTAGTTTGSTTASTTTGSTTAGTTTGSTTASTTTGSTTASTTTGSTTAGTTTGSTTASTTTGSTTASADGTTTAGSTTTAGADGDGDGGSSSSKLYSFLSCLY